MNNAVQLSPVVLRSDRRASGHVGKDLNRLIAAAVVNSQFCDVLLNNPEKAIENGFGGENFLLDQREKNILLSIKASNLADFAMQLVNKQNGKTKRRGEHGGGFWIPENSAMVTMDSK